MDREQYAADAVAHCAVAQCARLDALARFVGEDASLQKRVLISNIIRNAVAAERERCIDLMYREFGSLAGEPSIASALRHATSAIRKGE